VADIVAQFHVLDALGRGQGERPEHPPGPAAAGADHHTGGDVKAALNSDGALDIRPVVRAKRILDVQTDRVEFDGECLDVRGAQMGVFGYLSDGHQRLTG
jgi:hypothetical protein